jgi:hypothetical protein
MLMWILCASRPDTFLRSQGLIGFATCAPPYKRERERLVKPVI